jgi:hypothetical protein
MDDAPLHVSLMIQVKSKILYIHYILNITCQNLYHMPYQPENPISPPRATGPRGDICRGLIRHVIQILTCNVHYIIYFNHFFDNTCI